MNHQDGAVQAAKGVLFTLAYCASPSWVKPGMVILTGSSTALDIHEASVALAKMQKPLECSATLAESGGLLVSCLPLTANNAWLRSAAQTLATPVLQPSELINAGSVEATSASVLLVVGTDTIRMSPQDWKMVCRDYVILMPHGVSGREPSEEQRRDGIGWVLTIHPGMGALPQPSEFGSVPKEFFAALLEASQRPDDEAPG